MWGCRVTGWWRGHNDELWQQMDYERVELRGGWVSKCSFHFITSIFVPIIARQRHKWMIVEILCYVLLQSVPLSDDVHWLADRVPQF